MQHRPKNNQRDRRAAAAIADPPPAPEDQDRAKEDPEAESPPATTFWEFLATLGERWQTEALSLYIYRLWPVTDNRNPERFLCKLQECIDEDWLLKNFGSGKYYLILNNGKGKHLRKHVANPHHPDFGPRVAPQEVIESNPQNKLYFEIWARKEGHPAATQRPENNGADTANNGTDAAVKELAGLVKMAFGDRRKEADPVKDTLVAWALKQTSDERAADRQENGPTALAELLKALKDILPSKAADSGKSEMLAIIAALKDLGPRQQDPLAILAQAKELFAPADSESGGRERDTIGELDKVLSFAQRLASLQVPGAARRSGWDVGLDIAREVTGLARELGQPVLAMINNSMILQAKGKTAAPGGAPIPGAAFDPYANPAALRQHAQSLYTQAAAPRPMGSTAPQQPSQTQAPPQTQPAAGAQPPSAEQPNSDVTALIGAYGNLVLNAINSGVDGAQFADNVSALFGVAVPATIAQHGEETLAKAMLAIPEFTVFGEARVRRFCHEFCHYEEILADAEGDDDASEEKGKAEVLR